MNKVVACLGLHLLSKGAVVAVWLHNCSNLGDDFALNLALTLAAAAPHAAGQCCSAPPRQGGDVTRCLFVPGC